MHVTWEVKRHVRPLWDNKLTFILSDKNQPELRSIDINLEDAHLLCSVTSFATTLGPRTRADMASRKARKCLMHPQIKRKEKEETVRPGQLLASVLSTLNCAIQQLESGETSLSRKRFIPSEPPKDPSDRKPLR
jgi:hypothetical protein